MIQDLCAGNQTIQTLVCNICFNIVEQHEILNCKFLKRNTFVKAWDLHGWALIWEFLMESSEQNFSDFFKYYSIMIKD